jgi:hypothetical protein
MPPLRRRENILILNDLNPIGKIPMRPFGTKEFPNNSFEITMAWTIVKEFWRKLNTSSNLIVCVSCAFPTLLPKTFKTL